MSKVQITLGCDPELALVDQQSQFIPAVGLIGGTKQEPLQIHRNGTAIQEDGVMVEFNTPTAADPLQFYDIVQDSYRRIRQFVADKGYGVKIIDGLEFKKEQLVSEQARTLGCDPDLLAGLRGQQRRPPTIEELGNRRCAGGHVHIGYPNHGDDPGQIPGWVMIRFIQAGAYLQLLPHDVQNVRRKFYGLAGLYRDKPYGVEYRTPSSFWLSQRSINVQFLENIWRVARWVCRNTGKAQELWEEMEWDAIDRCISNGVLDQNVYGQQHDLYHKYGVYNG